MHVYVLIHVFAEKFVRRKGVYSAYNDTLDVAMIIDENYNMY